MPDPAYDNVSPISNDAALRLGIQTLIAALEVHINSAPEIDLPTIDEKVKAGIDFGFIAGERSRAASMVTELRHLLSVTR